MDKWVSLYIGLHLFMFLSMAPCYATQSKQCLKDQYVVHCNAKSDINEHLPKLRGLASECSSVGEIGLRGLVSTWGVLLGLSEAPYEQRAYIGIDIELPNSSKLKMAQKLAKENGIAFQFWLANDLDVGLPLLDMLFIDSLHTYCHLTYELETFSPYVNKYIAMHDTSYPWEYQDEYYPGDYSEYPAHIGRNKRGLWAAVVDFLSTHPEWELYARYTNNHGLTVLRRVE
jgi:hypothetical protein